jgi:hypothetical protein
MFMLKFSNILMAKPNFLAMQHTLFSVSVPAREVAKHYKVMSFNEKC